LEENPITDKDLTEVDPNHIGELMKEDQISINMSKKKMMKKSLSGLTLIQKKKQ